MRMKSCRPLYIYISSSSRGERGERDRTKKSGWLLFILLYYVLFNLFSYIYLYVFQKKKEGLPRTCTQNSLHIIYIFI